MLSLGYLAAIAPLAAAQFAPASTSSVLSLGPAPTESIGCRIVDGVWECSALRTSSTAPISTFSSATLPISSTSFSLTPSGLASPPTESVGCVLHIDHYHCEGPASGYTPTATSSGLPTIPSPTESSNCLWHETHWDCFDTSEQLSEAEDAEDTGECIIHVGHTHGDCSAEDLACGRILLKDYNMGLHIGSVFIILITSGLGVLLPIFSGWYRKSRIEGNGERRSSDSTAFGGETHFMGSVFFVARHFGTGIILSTAFIHLLYHGFVMFNNECIGHLSYESTAPAIALASAFLTFLFDFLGSRLAHPASSQAHVRLGDGIEKHSRESPSGEMDEGHNHGFDAAFMAEQNWQVMLLEAGIIFHSIMIGVTLGAGSGSGWTTLLIVIVFHQFFEGLALGARIALLQWISTARALIMGLVFTLITPIGIAIGIGVRRSFSQNGKASLLSVGILNSISAGILLYTAFKLLSSDFTDGPLRSARPFKVVVALVSVVLGMVAMSVLGKWA